MTVIMHLCIRQTNFCALRSKVAPESAWLQSVHKFDIVVTAILLILNYGYLKPRNLEFNLVQL